MSILKTLKNLQRSIIIEKQERPHDNVYLCNISRDYLTPEEDENFKKYLIDNFDSTDAKLIDNGLTIEVFLDQKYHLFRTDERRFKWLNEQIKLNS